MSQSFFIQLATHIQSTQMDIVNIAKYLGKCNSSSVSTLW